MEATYMEYEIYGMWRLVHQSNQQLSYFVLTIQPANELPLTDYATEHNEVTFPTDRFIQNDIP